MAAVPLHALNLSHYFYFFLKDLSFRHWCHNLTKKIQNQGIKVVLFCTLWIKSFTEPSLLHFEWQVRLMTLPKSLLFQYIGCVTVRLVPSLMVNDRALVNAGMVRPFEIKWPRNYVFLIWSSNLPIMLFYIPILFLFFSKHFDWLCSI